VNSSTATAPKPSVAAFSRLVPIAARFAYVRAAGVMFAAWSRSGPAVNLNCFHAYEKLTSDAERGHYLVARLAAIRAAFAVEFLRRVPAHSEGKYTRGH